MDMYNNYENTDNSELDRFRKFVNEYNFDLECLFDILTYKNNTIFLGDLESNTYYISDKLKNMFGFESNIVKDFANEWRKRIPNQSDLKIYDDNIQQLILNKEQVHDLVYKVKDAHGIERWIVCQGKIKRKDARQFILQVS